MLTAGTKGYFDELCFAMATLSGHHKAVFIGQGVGCAGTTMTDTLCNVPKQKLIEFPVAEDLQMGFAIGLSLQGWLPICIYPRWNFLLLAANQIVNHLDRLPLMGYKTRVIIRTAVPVTDTFNPGPQHDDDFSDAFSSMLRTVNVVKLRDAGDILPAYIKAAKSDRSTIMAEYTRLYGEITPSGVGK